MKISGRFKLGKIKSWQSFRPLVKKVLASIAAVALVCSAIPLMSWAVVGDTFTQDQLTYTVLTAESNNRTVSVKAKDDQINGNIEIPEIVTKDRRGNGPKYKVTKIEEQAFEYCLRLKSVTIGNSVTTIGDSAFWGCERLSAITIPDSVKKIGDAAFSSCVSLAEITIPDSVTTIGNCAFSGCKSLSSITIPNSVTLIYGYTFSECTGLTEIKIPNSVTLIYDYAFSECTGLTEITIPDSVEKIHNGAFKGCVSLAEITIPDSVKKIGNGAFDGCSSLGTIKISNQMDKNKDEIFRDSGISLLLSHHKYKIGSKVGEFVYIFDRNEWGESKEEHGVTYYVANDGTTSAEIIGDGITWLKEESGGTSAWYGIKNPYYTFEKSSRFWVRWITKQDADWNKYYNKIDPEKRKLADENLCIFLVGVKKRNGYSDSSFRGMDIQLYVQVGQDWPKEKIQAIFIEDGQDEDVPTTFIDNMDFPAGSGAFAELSLKHFSPYAVYEETNAGNNYFWLIFAAGTLLLAGGLIFILRKKAANKV